MSKLNYSWKVIYTDNSSFSQFENGEENRFGDIDLERIDSFLISRNHDNLEYALFPKQGVIFLRGLKIFFGYENCRIIYFRRVKMPFNFGGNIDSNSKTVFHVFGLQTTVDGVNKKVMFGIDDSGREDFMYVFE